MPIHESKRELRRALKTPSDVEEGKIYAAGKSRAENAHLGQRRLPFRKFQPALPYYLLAFENVE